MKKFFSSIKSSRGFTLIELLIVVAIIGLLSAVVLSSLGTARNKAKDAKVKAEMSQLRAQAEMYNDTNGNFGTAAATCTAGIFGATLPGLTSIVTSIGTSVGASMWCGSTATAWAVAATLPGGTQWCVDSTGASRAPASAVSATLTVCP